MGLFDRLFGSAPPPPPRRPPAATPESPLLPISGDGGFRVSAVGESNYRSAFEEIFGPRGEDGVDEECGATLILEDENPYDDRAIRVEIDGRRVGYLSREHAREYRKWLDSNGHGRARARCPAVVRGGWDRGGGDAGEFGVMLDLPVEAIAASRPVVPLKTVRPRRDDHGQPDMLINLTRRIDRSVHELLGLTKGIVADGRVSAEEGELLRAWLVANPEAASAWPGNVLSDRIDRIYADGHADDHEREDLRLLLESLAGGLTTDEGNPATRLPLDEPPPVLRFDGAVYVFTGRFYSGTRAWCGSRIEARGGVCASAVTRRTSYLVIGELGSRDWKHTSFGRKVQKAVELRSDGRPLAIVAEDHWASCL